jgi:cell division inhibitor SulA/protein ImuA
MVFGDPKIARLLEHPAIWRGRSAAQREGLPTGFAALDEYLPDNGWPRTGLIEILVSRFGSGELTLLVPALAMLTRAAAARWCVWVAPPLVPFAPALASCGVVLDRVAVVGGARFRGDPGIGHPSKSRSPLPMAFNASQDARFRGDPGMWAFEQTLGSGACDAVLGWVRQVKPRGIRRLQLAAERGRTLGVLFRPRRAAREASAAVLRLSVEPLAAGVRLAILKGRCAHRDALDLPWPGS